VLYLAEVKKHTRRFMGGVKTDFKLLACQHIDQTWSAIRSDETFSSEDGANFREGTLVLLNLNANRQLQGSPELAGLELVRQLQRISRLMEKGKDEKDKIEQWKQSLQYQSEELNRRQTELEAREEQIEQMEAEFEYLERQRQELDATAQKLRQEQEQLYNDQGRLGPALDLPPEQAHFVECIINRLLNSANGTDVLWQPIQTVREAIASQQVALEIHWRQLEEYRHNLGQKQQHLNQIQGHLRKNKQELQIVKSSLEQAQTQFQNQENLLASKQELLGVASLNLQTITGLRQRLTRLAQGLNDPELEAKIDMEALERMPLEDVEANLHQLQSDLEKLVSFVNDQEEELNLQSQAVEELMAKLAEANDDQRPSLEEELAEERERKGMLNRTLVGQRNNLSERQNILLIYEQIIKRRKGIEEDAHHNTINLEPILARLAQEQHQQEEEKARIEQEISHLQGSLAQIGEVLDPQWQEQEQKTRAMEEMEAKWQQAHLEINQLEAQVQLYDNALPPAQEKLNTIRHHFEAISEWLKPS